jgi:hypothetical protein
MFFDVGGGLRFVVFKLLLLLFTDKLTLFPPKFPILFKLFILIIVLTQNYKIGYIINVTIC